MQNDNAEFLKLEIVFLILACFLILNLPINNPLVNKKCKY